MRVETVHLERFRNYDVLDARFCDGINVICGDNAQGKTNLLEAVAYLSACRSHRARVDQELIQFQALDAQVAAQVFAHGREMGLDIRLHRGRRRRIARNGVRLKTVSELAGTLNTVLFCPEDLNLIRAGGAERRRFLDAAICQLRPRYAAALAEYKRLKERKSRILKDWPEKPALLELLDDFNLRMGQTGALVIHYRAHFVKKLGQLAPAIHDQFAGGREALTLDYETVKTVTDPLAPTQVLFGQLMDHLEGHRRAEIESHTCLSGPHKDDLLLSINGRSVKQFGSQGQTRTAALSLELAQRELFYQQDGEYPVLLLDDVLSELDPRRQEFVLHQIQGGQVLITCCEEERLGGLAAGQVLRIANGALWEG